ncbi:MAG TPA: PD-(D/E)XK nuclease family protein [Bryobacteraceae bacterium]
MKIQGIAPPPKEWAWSYSKLKNYDSCPKRHYEVDICKNFDDKIDPLTGQKNAALDEGDQAHDALAKACKQLAPLPAKFTHYQHWVDRVLAGPGTLLVEQKYAITRDFRPTTYFARDTWYRGIGDVVRIDGPVALVLDWKTGKILEDSVQLMLMAQCIFSHYPAVRRVRSEFVWLKEDCTTPEVFDRQEVANQWIGLLPRVAVLEQASKTLTYPPKPGPFCKKNCPVQSCPFFRKGTHGR